MPEHPNAALLRRLYRALTEGGYPATVAELFSEDVVWHLPGRHPLSGEHRGRDAALAAMRWFEERSGGTIRIEIHDILAGDEHAVALLRATGSRQGQRHDSLELDVFHLRDGMVTEFWSLAEDQRRTDEFWA